LYHPGTQTGAFMVKRGIAVLVGVIGGAVLWLVFISGEVLTYREEVSVQACAPDMDVDCVSEPGEVAEPAGGGEVARPCKDWFSDDEGGIAALSECMQASRRESDAERLRELQRAQKVSTSS
jgi:hypothetical protein